MRVGDKRGYINQGGEIVIKLQFDAVENFSKGLARVLKDNKWGYISREGQFFNQVRGFSEGLAAVQIGGKWGISI